MKNKTLLLSFFSMLVIACSGCTVVKGIFNTGVGVGIFITILVIVVIVVVAIKLFSGGK